MSSIVISHRNPEQVVKNRSIFGNTITKSLMLLPSTYGLMVWLTSVFLSQAGIVPADPISYMGWIIFFFVAALFIISMRLHVNSAGIILLQSSTPSFASIDYSLFTISTIIGVYGLYAYIIDTSAGIGSIVYFFQDLASASLSIRKASRTVESIGFQLSYFSWISIFLGTYVVFRTSAHISLKIVIALIIIAEFLLNLSFVARTRPIWILLTTGLAIYFSRNVFSVRVVRILFFTLVIPLITFLGFALLTGKYDVGRGAISSLVEYLISGPLYFDSLLNSNIQSDNFLLRTFYPISKVLESLGLISYVPDPLLTFRYVPFFTNVGTFLEPLYMDGGLPFVFLGSFLLIFGMDWLALIAFRQNTPIGRYMWANLIFAQLLCFFAPRYNTPALYLFGLIFIMMSVLGRAGNYNRH